MFEIDGMRRTGCPPYFLCLNIYVLANTCNVENYIGFHHFMVDAKFCRCQHFQKIVVHLNAVNYRLVFIRCYIHKNLTRITQLLYFPISFIGNFLGVISLFFGNI